MEFHSRFSWLPSPHTSALLFVVWLLLNSSVSPAYLVSGGVLALGIPVFTRPFHVPQPRILRPVIALKYLLMVMGDIVVANVHVAILILGPVKRLRPGFVKVPLDVTDELPITVLASTVSLTPGTISAEIYPLAVPGCEPEKSQKRYLLIHVLDLKEADGLIRSIKQRYEAPLKEIFQC